MKKQLIAAGVIAAALAGCGSSSHSSSATTSSTSAAAATTSTTTASTDSAALAKITACSHVQANLVKVAADAGTLAKNSGDVKGQAQMATDAGQLGAYVTALEADVTDPGQKASLSQYASVMTQLQTSMQGGEGSGIESIADQMQLLLPKITAICS